MQPATRAHFYLTEAPRRLRAIGRHGGNPPPSLNAQVAAGPRRLRTSAHDRLHRGLRPKWAAHGSLAGLLGGTTAATVNANINPLVGKDLGGAGMTELRSVVIALGLGLMLAQLATTVIADDLTARRQALEPFFARIGRVASGHFRLSCLYPAVAVLRRASRRRLTREQQRGGCRGAMSSSSSTISQPVT